ncbi:MAG: hypothetical protein PVH88_12185 [Ignavibacteria bacterium]|jgi:hypothetical protein
MLQAVIFKEWLKIRWVFAGMLLISFLVTINIFFDVSNVLKVYSANLLLSKLIYYEVLYYDDITYLPLLIGILIGVFQFFPEVNQKRLKLTFHLPVKESKMLFQMVGVGFIALIMIFIFDAIMLSIISLHFFPVEIFQSMIITIIPWFLAGCVGYFLMVMLFVEPAWYKRVVLTLAGIGLLFLFYSAKGYAKYENSWWIFAVITLLFASVIYISAYNFKRGIS